MKYLQLEKVEMVFDTKRRRFHALRDINLAVEQGEFVSIIGHSGCGKSTLLNLVAGLILPSSGAMLCAGREITGPGPERAMVFQNHSLLPWLTVYENVRLGVDKVFGRSKSTRERDDWTRHNLALVHMEHALAKRPQEISGGMKQRVGIARALAMEPKLLLMDEPFGALDALTRASLQDAVMEIHARLGNTVLMVPHDVDEAVLLSGRIVMMTNGPATPIGEIMSIDLPRPRKREELADNAAYTHHRAAVLKYLYQRQPRPEEAARRNARHRGSRARSQVGGSNDQWPLPVRASDKAGQ